ncbi:hypothetical protein BH10PSE19_BH10PSE19_02800 [soil metagenome]
MEGAMKIKYFISIAIFLLAFITNSYAEPNENTTCYKKCLAVREACRKSCVLAHKQHSNSIKYSCMDSCDKPFNDQCITKCPQS